MKKVFVTILLTVLTVTLICTSKTTVNGLSFNETYVDQLCYYSQNFDDSYVNVDEDDEFGLSYLVSEETVETITLKTEKNWLGVTTETEILPKVKILTYNYPIMLDTHGEIITYDGASSDLEQLDLAPEMILAGESYEDTMTYSVNETETKSNRLSWALGYTRSSYLGATIPVNGVNIGASLSSTLQADVEGEYDYTTTKSTYSYKTITTSVDNTSSSVYYQNGDPIFVQFGTRYLFRLQVVVVVEFNYSTTSYVTGSWFSKVTHYTNTFTNLENPSMYKDFEYYTYYSRNHFPFVYTVSPTDGSYVLVDELRTSNRYYGD